MAPLLSEYITRKRMQAITPHLSGDILDLGCGYSRVPNWLEPHQKYVGVELDTEIIKWLRTTYPQHEFHQRNIEIENLAMEGKFDTILMAAILEHIKNPDQLFQQLSEYLKPQGKIVMTTPTPLGGFVHTIGAKLGLFYSEAAEEHEKFYDLDAVQATAKKTDLKVTEYRKFLFGGNQLIVCQA